MSAEDQHNSGPEVVCICGSMRRWDRMMQVAGELTRTGAIVLLPIPMDGITADDEPKAQLGELHLRRIDLADRIVVIGNRTVLGQSTMHEVVYARAHGKSVDFAAA